MLHPSKTLLELCSALPRVGQLSQSEKQGSEEQDTDKIHSDGNVG